MNWIPWVIFAVVLVLVMAYRRTSQIATRAAQELLAQGARVIDVRTPAEFAAEHLPQASSLPLEQITRRVREEIPDRSTVLLLHCQSGVRSGLAVQRLKSLGYAQTHNLGSFSRAKKIVEGLR